MNLRGSFFIRLIINLDYAILPFMSFLERFRKHKKETKKETPEEVKTVDREQILAPYADLLKAYFDSPEAPPFDVLVSDAIVKVETEHPNVVKVVGRNVVFGVAAVVGESRTLFIAKLEPLEPDNISKIITTKTDWLVGYLQDKGGLQGSARAAVDLDRKYYEESISDTFHFVFAKPVNRPSSPTQST